MCVRAYGPWGRTVHEKAKLSLSLSQLHLVPRIVVIFFFRITGTTHRRSHTRRLQKFERSELKEEMTKSPLTPRLREARRLSLNENPLK